MAMSQVSREMELALQLALEISECAFLLTKDLILELHINLVRGNKKWYVG